MIIKQISLFMENSTGRLAGATDLLAEANINLRAISIADTTEFGILRMVADQPEKAVKLLKEAGFAARETDVIGVEIPDVPGSLARIMALFRAENVGIEYLYASLDHQVGKASIIIKADNTAAALALLEKHGFAAPGKR